MPRILVVEDEAAIAEHIVALLGARGYAMSSSGDGIEALELARKAPPDLVLLDVVLPRLSGFEICKLLRADPRTRKVKIIMVTGLDRGGDVEKAFAVGADDYLVKPFDTERLLKKIQKALLSS